MTDTPMTPDREQEIRTLDLLELTSDRAAPVISGHLAALLREIDRLRSREVELEVQVKSLVRELIVAHGCPSCAAPTDETGNRIPKHRTGCPLDETAP
ncbi:hypothetical protein AB0D56_10035 [Streptomyces sp. NPDC048209]|uniref:hypothetical protein n=1 Tax=Streptomyces sp. NPDC048209 TaxID=3156689 RepID=UPI003419A3BA